MARPLRIEYPGAIYHVITRGVAKMTTFCEDADYWFFLRLLKAQVELGTLIIHAFALIPNHPHMLCETPGGGLGRIMKMVLGGFAQAFNSKYERFGHVFQARYKAILVEDGEYLLRCSRYIHRNPTKAHLVTSPDLYPWSSYRNYLGQPAVVDWIETAKTLSHFTSRQQYREFVEAGSDEDLEDPFQHARAGLVYGSEEFLKRIGHLLKDRKEDPEIPSLKHLKRITDPPSQDEVVKAVERLFSDFPQRERDRILIYALHRFSWLQGNAIARIMGISPATVSRALRAAESSLEVQRMMREQFAALVDILGKTTGGKTTGVRSCKLQKSAICRT